MLVKDNNCGGKKRFCRGKVYFYFRLNIKFIMQNLFLFKKQIVQTILVSMISLIGYAQKDIVKNKVKINHLDKNDIKQGDWFFFDDNDDIVLSCKYKDDSIVSPLTFYKNNDTAFIRFPEINGSETFIIHMNGQQIVGNYEQVTKDSSVIEPVGLYKQVSKDSFYIETDSIVSYSTETINEVHYWFNKEIPPIYMFGNAKLYSYFFARLNFSTFTFNRKINALININESGIVTSVDFPRDKNSLSSSEETELSYIFSALQRWQPYFLKNKTVKYSKPFILTSTIKN